MRLVVLRTFLTLVNDESPEPNHSRARSAPADLHYEEPPPPSTGDGGAAAAVPAKPRKKKKQAKRGSAIDEDPDELVFEEYAPIVAQERAQLPSEFVARPAQVGTNLRRRGRGRGGKAETTMTCARDFFEHAHIRLRLNVHEPSEPRPANAIFLLREGLGDIGIEYNAQFSTTTLRAWLLGINGYEWDDGFVVESGNNGYVPIGSTIGEQGIAPGAQLRLVRPADVSVCPQS